MASQNNHILHQMIRYINITREIQQNFINVKKEQILQNTLLNKVIKIWKNFIPLNCDVIFFTYQLEYLLTMQQWRAGRGGILGGAKPVKRGACKKCMKWNKNVNNSVKSFQALLQER